MLRILLKNICFSRYLGDGSCLVKRTLASQKYENKYKASTSSSFPKFNKTYERRSYDDYKSHIKNSLKESSNSRVGGLLNVDQWTQIVEEKRSVFSVFGKQKKDADISTVYLENTGKIIRNGKPVVGNEVSCYEPLLSFKNLIGLDARLKTNLERLGYDRTTPVQSFALPAIINSEDVLALAQTGSGKTVAFLLPLLHHLLTRYPEHAMKLLAEQRGQVQFPSGLIIAPTRELVQQIAHEAFKLTYSTPLRIVELFGGSNPVHQARALTNGAHIIVATPGRLLDFLDQNLLSLRACKHLVLDEADRCFDMGFEPQIRRLFSSSYGMPTFSQGRQTLLFSATFAPEVRHLANEFLSPSHLQLTIGTPGEVPRTIKHEFVDLDSIQVNGDYQSIHQLRYDALCSLLASVFGDGDSGSSVSSDRVLVFCQTKRLCDDVEYKLRRSGYTACAIHGDKSQRQRDEALHSFKGGDCPILIGSDVAARGLDIPNVSMVVNYEMPLTLDSYTHRVGRTGRLGRQGRAVTLISKSSSDAMSLAGFQEDLCALLRNAGHPIPHLLHERILKTKQHQKMSGAYNKRDGDRRSVESDRFNLGYSNRYENGDAKYMKRRGYDSKLYQKQRRDDTSY